MNRSSKDYVNTFIHAILFLMIAVVFATLSVITGDAILKHMFNNFVDKPTAYVASPETNKAMRLFTYKLPEPIVANEEPKVEEPVLSRGGTGIPKTKKLDTKEQIHQYVNEICARYDNKIKPELVMSMIEHESNFNPKARVGSCVGLMQVSSKWHANRASKLGVTNFYDPHSNILLGVDYLNELLTQYKDIRLVLMLYNMNHNDAISMYHQGKISTYAKSVLSKAEHYKKGE